MRKLGPTADTIQKICRQILSSTLFLMHSEMTISVGKHAKSDFFRPVISNAISQLVTQTDNLDDSVHLQKNILKITPNQTAMKNLLDFLDLDLDQSFRVLVYSKHPASRSTDTWRKKVVDIPNIKTHCTYNSLVFTMYAVSVVTMPIFHTKKKKYTQVDTCCIFQNINLLGFFVCLFFSPA